MFGNLFLYRNSFVANNTGAMTSGGVPPPSSSLLTGLISYWTLNAKTSPFTNSITSGIRPTLDYSNSGVGLSSSSNGVDGTYSIYSTGEDSASGLEMSSPSNGVTSGTATLSFWFKQDSGIAGDSTTYGLMDLQNVNPASVCFASITSGSSENTFVFYGNGALTDNDIYYNNTAVGDWNHIIIQLNSIAANSGLQYAAIYINNVFVGVLNGTADNPALDITSDLDFCAFGFNYQGDGSVAGFIDEVGYWNRALTSTERTNLYNAGVGNTYPF
jgi:hypothetical protein